MALVAEDIADGEVLSRGVDFPHKYQPVRKLLLDAFLEFPRDKDTKEPMHESVIWRRYLKSDDEVHALGCAKEKAKREQKPQYRYIGFTSATAAQIRQVRNKAGHGFDVEHSPAEGEPWHTSLFFKHATGEPASAIPKLERVELREMIRNAFGAVVEHACPT